MTPFAAFAWPALLVAVLTVLASASATADQRMFDDFLHGDTSTAVAWIESGGDPEVRDKDGHTLMHWAAWRGEVEIARSLRERGVDVNIRVEPEGTIPVMMASQGGHPEMVDYLLAEGADVRATVARGDSVLHFAASAKPWNPMVFESLIKAGADVDAVAELNAAVIHRAVTENHPELVDILLDAGADPLIGMVNPGKEGDGMLPLDLARAYSPSLLSTDAGRRLQRLTYEGTGCEGVIVLAGDTKLSILAERTLGKTSRWKEIAELNGLEGKGYKKGDCLALP